MYQNRDDNWTYDQWRSTWDSTEEEDYIMGYGEIFYYSLPQYCAFI
jgi:hypothetical protein